jgi:hypothetical protein
MIPSQLSSTKKCPARRPGKKINRNEYHNDWPRCAQ